MATTIQFSTPRYQTGFFLGVKMLSRCHQEEMQAIHGDEGTSYYICTKCGAPCGIFNPYRDNVDLQDA